MEADSDPLQIDLTEGLQELHRMKDVVCVEGRLHRYGLEAYPAEFLAA